METAIKYKPPVEANKINLIARLQKEVYDLQRIKKVSENQSLLTGLKPIEESFPDKTFPTGAVHEFISYEEENAAATNGFITALAGKLMQQSGACLWISTGRTLFPSALKAYGIDTERIIFIDVNRPIDVLWATEEALKCQSLTTVISEISEITFNQSRRLQLAVEASNVTGLIHRYKPRTENTTASVARWKITPLSSNLGTIPGIGYPKWNIELTKVRNGKPGTWQVQWTTRGFEYPSTTTTQTNHILKRKAG